MVSEKGRQYGVNEIKTKVLKQRVSQRILDLAGCSFFVVRKQTVYLYGWLDHERHDAKWISIG